MRIDGPRLALALTCLLRLTGCATTGDDDLYPEGFPDFEDYLGDSKADTGYVGSRAAELEATFEGRVRALVPGSSAAELETIAAELRASPTSWEHRSITAQITEQTKFARNALQAQDLNLNLEGGEPELTSVTVVDGGLELAYRLRVESLVKFKDLEARGLTPQDLVGRVVEPRLPLVPSGLFERIGNRCSTDPDSGAAVEASELGAHNLFYYFDAARQGCPLAATDLVTGRYTVESSLDAPTVYPEYDRLVADGRVTMTAIFGQITHGELEQNDWGFIAYNSFARSLSRLGFRVVQTYPENRGQRMEKRYAGGLVVSVDMQTPVSYADSVPREQANERFRTAIRENEIVYYNGHAFYGSLTVLDDPSVYPADVYQIVFMDACWSYAYYTKQIFRNRATAEDPEGYRNVDVINNTEPGITGSETTAALLYENIFRGAAATYSRGNATQYSWNNLTKYMNDHAEVRARQRTTHPDPEIYGVSGVRTNAFNPNGAPPPVVTPTTSARFESTTRVSIPDDDTMGASSVIAVPSATSGNVTSVSVSADVTHTYIGDLRIVLRHGGRELVLHDHSGGSADNLTLRVPSDAFAGTPRSGEWTLHVVDNAAVDTGAVTRWSIELAP
jgi:hypothetical protein